MVCVATCILRTRHFNFIRGHQYQRVIVSNDIQRVLVRTLCYKSFDYNITTNCVEVEKKIKNLVPERARTVYKKSYYQCYLIVKKYNQLKVLKFDISLHHCFKTRKFVTRAWSNSQIY